MNASDVITADGFSRNVIVINEQFPGPTIEVMEGVQVCGVCVMIEMTECVYVRRVCVMIEMMEGM